MEFRIVRLELVVRLIPRSTQFARIVRTLEMLCQGIIAGEICIEAAEDADVVPFGKPGVVVFGLCGAEIAIQRVQVVFRTFWFMGGFGGLMLVVWKKREEDSRGRIGEVSLTRGSN